MSVRQLRQWLESISLDELREIAALMNQELARREGREKYRLPDHVQKIL